MERWYAEPGAYAGSRAQDEHRTAEAGRGSQPATRVEMLHRALGNDRLMQLRRSHQRTSPVQRQAEAPAWIKNQLGITRADEQNLARQESAMAAAADESTTVPGGGQRLPAETAQAISGHLGIDISDTRVVQNADAACRSMGAHAYATTSGGGEPVVALSSGVDLKTPEGQFTLNHELAHIAQQKRGESNGLTGLGGDPAQREALEQDADDRANAFLNKGR